MLSEDFALVGTDRMTWDEFYKDNVANYDDQYFIYRTFYFKYKGREYQFERVCYDDINAVDSNGSKYFNGKLITDQSYIFIIFGQENGYSGYMAGRKVAICYDNFKEAVDNAKMTDGKTLKEIWDDPDSEVIDFN